MKAHASGQTCSTSYSENMCVAYLWKQMEPCWISKGNQAWTSRCCRPLLLYLTPSLQDQYLDTHVTKQSTLGCHLWEVLLWDGISGPRSRHIFNLRRYCQTLLSPMWLYWFILPFCSTSDFLFYHNYVRTWCHEFLIFYQIYLHLLFPKYLSHETSFYIFIGQWNMRFITFSHFANVLLVFSY